VVTPNLDDAYALAKWLTGRGTDAEDVVQEACIRALRDDRLTPGNARTRMLTIVHATAYDWLRENRPAALVLVEDVAALEDAQDAAPPAASPGCAWMAAEDASLFEAALFALPVQYREALVLREVQGLSYREIAELSGTSVGTTMSRLIRARRLLVAFLNKKGALESSLRASAL
jgi:RNA polymerase sigma-70 factor (ECF subfamily)